jgi:hypothetical protein
MLTTFNPGLRRNNIVLNSFHSGISNTPKEFSWTPEMSLSKMVSQPRMLSKKLKGRVSFKQLKSLADTNSRRNFNKQMDMININMQLIDFESMLICNLPYEKFTVLPDNQELERVLGIFRFPDKMECILSKGMFKSLQIHFLSPQTFIRNKALTMFVNLFSRGSTSEPFFINNSEELNLTEHGSPHSALKQRYPSLLM